ncbi:MAG TPA: beta-propeller fold lactonase family protein [Terriglobales bacterium]|nr:beta-propeller fold lactonase family protein [Terriglobales bacterium]
MSFLRAARAALVNEFGLPAVLVAMVAVMAGLSLSCGGSGYTRSAPNHNAYVTLPQRGSVLQLNINGATGVITIGAETPQVENSSPTGLALLSSKKFLYTANSRANTISIFNVASDGTLTLSGTPTPAGGSGPNAMVIDPTGKYMLVTNNLTDNVSVFSIDAGSGALTLVGSPVFANASPTEILIIPSGKFVYVTNPGLGMVTAFTFSGGVLQQMPTSPVISGAGAFGLAVDGSGRFLYVANPSAPNPSLNTTGNISGFNIDPNTGALTPMLGSPFNSGLSTVNSAPTALTLDPFGRFLYATAAGSSDSIWCFTITSTNGQLVPVTDSPFSLAAGGLFVLIDPSGNYFYTGTQTGNGIGGYTYNSSTGAPTVISGSPFSTIAPPGKMVLSE